MSLGHNLPPEDADPLRERLESDHAELIDRANELLAAVERVPEAVDDTNAGKVGDFIKQITGHMKTLDKVRVSEKEPYLAGGRNVDGFFNPLKETLSKAKGVIEARLTSYERVKAAEERRRLEEEARKQREEEERLRREAEEIARRQQEEQERLRKEAEARTKAIKDEADLEKAIAAEEEAARVAEAQLQARQEAERAAMQAEADRIQAEREAKAKAADLSRTRGDLGSVSSLRTFWDFEVLDAEHIPLEPLRAHLHSDAIDKAIRSFVKAGGRELKGVKIFENTKTVVR